MKYEPIFPFFRGDSCEFNTWAPKANKVQLELCQSGQLIEMQPQQRGYWSATIENTKPGTRYKYRLNDSQSYPDPASLSQPDGVHEASEVVNLKNFEWTDDDWKNIPLKEMIQYELHTGTFSSTGNFDEIRQKLKYFKELGINTIEILPVAQFSGHRNWGYDGVYPFAVQNSYGGAHELMTLVNECHKNGIAVILDVVYNHFGPEGNYVGNFGHYFSGKYSTPWGKPINFDEAYSDGVRNYIIQNVLMWCRDFHIDGLRLDAVHSIFDFGAKHIMQELAEKLDVLSHETGWEHYLIAESHLNDVKYISPVSSGGYGLDAQWSDDFHHAIHTLTTNERNSYYMDFGETQQLSKSIKDVFVFDGQYSEFRKKTYGNSTANNPGEQFVIFNQNHDQVGNRMNGDRLISLTDFETAKTIAATMFVTPNVPMLFMGEEYGERNPFYYFVSHQDPELNRLVREGRKEEFKDFYDNTNNAVDPDSTEAFENSKLSWNIEDNAEKKAMFGCYQTLIRLRKEHPVLQLTDKNNLKISEQGKLIVLERWQEERRLFAVINFEDKEKSLKVQPNTNKPLTRIFGSSEKSWNGPGEITPKSIVAGDEISVNKKSIVIYSN
ncbi:malto-oligosyltrehalose trehalohydrolase [Draconibacterium halophilum]|uniref:Malto-oligosyltrehalose trehalohydrolase n=1 Tax=Draconibacterium halophilum TaxID=2706887 RepID=A0A6C0RHR1_9BACT|nr:malto-oligosyltrehalose trehalohydrolase [Draconibacterium halophilum]QIA09073.1 malto-oligosyltrehalose trehalohydrolase [Draconibacterium halophilum]